MAVEVERISWIKYYVKQKKTISHLENIEPD